MRNDADEEKTEDHAKPFEAGKTASVSAVTSQGTSRAVVEGSFSLSTLDEENMRLLEPYMREMAVNGRPCRVLRDSAATMDVVRPAFVTPQDFTGECAWISQMAQEESGCLPVARVTIKGLFWILHTEAAV